MVKIETDTIETPQAFEDYMSPFIGQRWNNDMLEAIKQRTIHRLHSQMACGQIEYIPKLWVGEIEPQRVAIHTPQYAHDCEGCEYFGQYNHADLYLHKGAVVTLIVRFSNGPSDYASSPIWVDYGDCYSSNPGRHYFAELRRRAGARINELLHDHKP